MTRAWLHHSALFTTLATPVRVLSSGPKRARVRLVHRLRWEGKWAPAGSTRYVPVYALGALPNASALVGVGRGRFVRRDSYSAECAILKWAERSVICELVKSKSRLKLTDKSTRAALTAARASGRMGVKK